MVEIRVINTTSRQLCLSAPARREPETAFEIRPAEAYRMLARLLEQTPLHLEIHHHSTLRWFRPEDIPVDGHQTRIGFDRDELILVLCMVAAMIDAGDVLSDPCQTNS